MKSKKIVGIIPARLGSTRLPEKMLITIDGKPLIQHTYENALKCEVLNEVVVATDDRSIYDTINSFGGQVVMTSKDCLSGSDRLAEAVRDNPRFNDIDIIVNIQGDEPKISSETIAAVAKALVDDNEFQVSTACVKIQNEEDAFNRSIVKCVKGCNGQALYFSRAMIPHGKKGAFNEEISYYKHLGIYAYRKDFLLKYLELPPTPLQIAEDLEQLKILEHGVGIFVVEVFHDSVGIDTLEDLKKI